VGTSVERAGRIVYVRVGVDVDILLGGSVGGDMKRIRTKVLIGDR